MLEDIFGIYSAIIGCFLCGSEICNRKTAQSTDAKVHETAPNLLIRLPAENRHIWHYWGIIDYFLADSKTFRREAEQSNDRKFHRPAPNLVIRFFAETKDIFGIYCDLIGRLLAGSETCQRETA